MREHHHKTATIILSALGLLIAGVGAYVAYDNHRDKKMQRDIVDLDRQIKELQLLKLKKTV